MYPVLKVSRKSLNIKVDDGHNVSYASSGKPHIKILNDKPVYTLSFTHVVLNQAQQNTVLDYYTARKYDWFEFQNSDSGKSYQMRYIAPPEPVNQRRGFADIQVQLIGTEND